MLLFRSHAAAKSIIVRRTNFGLEVVAKGLGRVHTVVSKSFLKGEGTLPTLANDRREAFQWARDNGFALSRGVETQTFQRRDGRALSRKK